MIPELGTALRVNAHPMCNRYLDPVPLFLRAEAKRRKWIGVDDKIANINLGEETDKKILTSAFMAAIILRCTGRVSRFASFAEWSENYNDIFLPTNVMELELFLDYVSLTMKGTGEDGFPMSSWLSAQYFGSIPQQIRQDYKMFELMMTNMYKGNSQLLEKICNCVKEGGKGMASWEKASDYLEECLRVWCGNDSTGKIEFLTQHILADVEGIFGRVFGEVDPANVVAGHAGGQEHILLNWHRDKRCKLSLHELLQKIVDGVNDGSLLDEELLLLGGYEKVKGVVVNTLNGLTFNCIDAEHWLCKTWMLVKHTFQHYRNSLFPVPLQPHTHPIVWPVSITGDQYLKDEKVDTIMEKITSVFTTRTNLNVCDKRHLKLPEIIVI